MTKDLVAGLGWEFSECERLKLTVGLVPEDGCLATSNHLKFLKPRVTELCALIGKRFSLYARALDGGVMLCGGASYLRGLTQEFAKELQVTSPFVCQLTRPAVEAFLPGLLINHLPNSLSSAYLSLMANTANLRDDLFARRKNDLERPFAKLRPLWTWLSELSR
jgi:cell division ATPase FtsA